MMIDAATALPTVAVVGRPNVGKSSLVNRILGRREAIVQETPGVTRDRRSFAAEWAGRRFEVIDTGGLEPGQHGLDARVAEQAELAIATADVILFLVDAGTGPTQDDLEVARRLRRSGKPVVLAANKVDDPRDEPGASEFYRLGLGRPHPVSALHGRGSGDLLDAVIAALPPGTLEEPGQWASFAIVGRPNVGKSSILNGLLGEARAIVHDRPGTTRDPVDSVITVDGSRDIRMVDTAGMRRQTRIDDPIEYFSFLRSRGTIARSDAVALVIDASEGVTGHDQRIADEIVEHGRACAVVLNKWDLVTSDEIERRRVEAAIARKIRFLPWADVIRVSALTGRGMDRIVPTLIAAVESHRRRIPTALVNRVIESAQEARPHPRTGGRSVTILYAVQATASPPTFVLFSTRPLDQAYLRYLENRIREVDPFTGSPLRFVVRVREKP